MFYREALKEWTREIVPLQWAMTQNNLGYALQALGQRESGTETLTKAADAYRKRSLYSTKSDRPTTGKGHKEISTRLWPWLPSGRRRPGLRQASDGLLRHMIGLEPGMMRGGQNLLAILGLGPHERWLL